MNNQLKEYCEEHDWNVYESDGFVELEKYSPAGEDFIFSVESRHFVEKVRQYAMDFDVDEHAMMWVENMKTVNGVPQSIRILLTDAEEIEKMLIKLAEGLESIKLKPKISYHKYAYKNDYSLSLRQLKYWAKRHKKAIEENDYDTVDWIEDLLTCINYHTECGLFVDGKYEQAFENYINA